MSELIFSFPLTSLRLKRNKMLQQMHTAIGKDSAAINSEILKFSYRKLYGKKAHIEQEKKCFLNTRTRAIV